MDRKPLKESHESFLERWSRRKRGATDAEEAGSIVAGPEPAAAREAEAETPPLADADLPPIESLGDDDDYSDFLSEGVSESLRQAALRRLFRSPKFNVTDGLDDYAEDFTTFAPLGNIVTADMKHRAQQLLDKLAQDAGGDVGAPEDRIADGDAAQPEQEGATGAAESGVHLEESTGG
jgi:hypothetical protein